MKLSEMEIRVLDKLHSDMLQANSTDGINKLYRQGRIWNRWHSIGMQRNFSKDPTYCDINSLLKQFRIEAKEALTKED